MGHLLSLLIFSPLIAIVTLLFTKKKEKLINIVGVLGTVLPFLITVVITVFIFTGKSYSEFQEKISWLTFAKNTDRFPNGIAIDYELGLDGLSLAMILLTTIIALFASVASVLQIKQDKKGYFLTFFILEIGMLGLFLAENFLLFFFFFEITFVTMFFFIGKWGFFAREKAAYQFLLYNGIGSALLLVVIITLIVKLGTTNFATLQFEIANITNGSVPLMTTQLKWILFIILIIALAIKLPVFPFHRWMVYVHNEAPLAIVMIHAGVLLKIGAYGFIRFGIGLFPEQFQAFSTVLLVFGLINLLYGAFLALIQTELKLVFAYSSISHMGFVLLGLGVLNEAGIQGAIFQTVSHGLIAALLFFLVGIFTKRYGTTNLEKLSGTAKQLPIASGLLLAAGMASLGLPGTSGFISEVTVFIGLFEKNLLVGMMAVLGIILTAAYILRAVLAITFGTASEVAAKLTEKTAKLQLSEKLPAFVLVGIIILIGLYPNTLEWILRPVITEIFTMLGGGL
ncbi:complex I subunit 4 family protein [Bacillus kwashiorkori]|uniref:complex I subunit 4 family protein n=1 Tax=Bacillus kwashiorkori TaxID=1522318 RepID=UPI0007821304|nr:NADH-quinone oxidoreductase subunit M [Bacillus kwashiorkori]